MDYISQTGDCAAAQIDRAGSANRGRYRRRQGNVHRRHAAGDGPRDIRDRHSVIAAVTSGGTGECQSIREYSAINSTVGQIAAALAPLVEKGRRARHGDADGGTLPGQQRQIRGRIRRDARRNRRRRHRQGRRTAGDAAPEVGHHHGVIARVGGRHIVQGQAGQRGGIGISHPAGRAKNVGLRRHEGIALIPEDTRCAKVGVLPARIIDVQVPPDANRESDIGTGIEFYSFAIDAGTDCYRVLRGEILISAAGECWK